MGYELRSDDLKSTETLGRPLNETLKDVDERLARLEGVKTGFVTVELAAAPTFPIRITPPTGVRPRSVKLGLYENLQTPGAVPAAAIFPVCRVETDGTITLLGVVGLPAARVRLTLEVTGNG